MILGLIGGIVIYVMAWDMKSRAGYWLRFLGAFLVTYCLLSL